jgi:hypothetical protein
MAVEWVYSTLLVTVTGPSLEIGIDLVPAEPHSQSQVAAIPQRETNVL